MTRRRRRRRRRRNAALIIFPWWLIHKKFFCVEKSRSIKISSLPKKPTQPQHGGGRGGGWHRTEVPIAITTPVSRERFSLCIVGQRLLHSSWVSASLSRGHGFKSRWLGPFSINELVERVIPLSCFLIGVHYRMYHLKAWPKSGLRQLQCWIPTNKIVYNPFLEAVVCPTTFRSKSLQLF